MQKVIVSATLMIKKCGLGINKLQKKKQERMNIIAENLTSNLRYSFLLQTTHEFK